MIIWKSNKFSCSNMVLRSFSVIIKPIADEEETFWLTSIYGPNKSNLRKDFWVNLQDLFGLPFSNWGGGGRDFDVMRFFDEFVSESELINPPLKNTSFT